MTNEDDESLAEIIASLKEINEAEEQIIKYSRSVAKRHFQQYFSYIVAVSFIGG
jgi:uncharacterized protein YaaQ